MICGCSLVLGFMYSGLVIAVYVGLLVCWWDCDLLLFPGVCLVFVAYCWLVIDVYLVSVYG